MRAAGTLTIFAVAAIAAVAPAHAQRKASPAADYPGKPIRMIVPVAAGGGTDIIARLIGQGLSERLGQSVVVDNRPGAGGIIGTDLVAKAAADGYTLLLGSIGHITFSPALYRNKLPYDPRKDFAPVSLAANQPFVMTAHASFTGNTIGELLAQAKNRPGEIRYASGGIGGASHLGTELLQHLAGVKLTHVPYKGTGPGMTAVLSGEVQILLVGVATALPHIRSNRVKAFAVSGAKRSQALPQLPTMSEAGVPGYDFDVWYGMLFPAGTPRAIVARANSEIVRLLKSPAAGERFAGAGLEPLGSTPEEFADRIRREIPKWEKVVGIAGIKVD